MGEILALAAEAKSLCVGRGTKTTPELQNNGLATMVVRPFSHD
jgi:hypothetical protein